MPLKFSSNNTYKYSIIKEHTDNEKINHVIVILTIFLNFNVCTNRSSTILVSV